jgi:hypothetical protein
MSGGDCTPDVVEDISPDEVIWRRVGPDQIVMDELGEERPSSSIFKSRKSNGISLHRARLIQLETIRERYPGQRLAELTVRDVLLESSEHRQFRVIADPINNHPVQANDESHACIVPTNTSRSVADHLAQKSRLVTP